MPQTSSAVTSTLAESAAVMSEECRFSSSEETVPGLLWRRSHILLMNCTWEMPEESSDAICSMGVSTEGEGVGGGRKEG